MFEALKQAVDVPTALAFLDLSCRRGRFCCPAHEDTNPSASFRRSTPDRWLCFTCGQGGDVVDLVALARGLRLGAAAAWLEQRAGITALPDRGPRVQPPTEADYDRELDRVIALPIDPDAFGWLVYRTMKDAREGVSWSERIRTLKKYERMLEPEDTRAAQLCDAYCNGTLSEVPAPLAALLKKS